eukprot:4552224-Pleurochrysis_carterae.AAC.1
MAGYQEEAEKLTRPRALAVRNSAAQLGGHTDTKDCAAVVEGRLCEEAALEAEVRQWHRRQGCGDVISGDGGSSEERAVIGGGEVVGESDESARAGGHRKRCARERTA